MEWDPYGGRKGNLRGRIRIVKRGWRMRPQIPQIYVPGGWGVSPIKVIGQGDI